jgi:hypothetical protein
MIGIVDSGIEADHAGKHRLNIPVGQGLYVNQ